MSKAQDLEDMEEIIYKRKEGIEIHTYKILIRFLCPFILTKGEINGKKKDDRS